MTLTLLQLHRQVCLKKKDVYKRQVMIGVINGKIKRVPLAECAGKLKMVSPKDQLVKAAKQIGISFGD